MERRGTWIVKQAQQPPYTLNNAARGFWRLQFGDTTKMAAPGEYVDAKYTVWLDKKPGGRAWKYEWYTNYVLCPSEPGKKATAAPRARKKAKKTSTPPTNAGSTPTDLPAAPAPPSANGGTGGGMTAGEATLPDGRLPTGRGGK